MPIGRLPTVGYRCRCIYREPQLIRRFYIDWQTNLCISYITPLHKMPCSMCTPESEGAKQNALFRNKLSAQITPSFNKYCQRSTTATLGVNRQGRQNHLHIQIYTYKVHLGTAHKSSWMSIRLNTYIYRIRVMRCCLWWKGARTMCAFEWLNFCWPFDLQLLGS